MNILPILAAVAVGAYFLSEDKQKGPLQLRAGTRYNLTQVAPTMPIATAERAADSLRQKGHQGVIFRAASRGGVAFHYTSFPMPADMVLALGQQSALGPFPTTLLAVRGAGSKIPTEYMTA